MLETLIKGKAHDDSILEMDLSLSTLFTCTLGRQREANAGASRIRSNIYGILAQS